MTETVNNYNSLILDNIKSASQSLKDRLLEWDKDKKPINKLKWNEYFISMAYISSLRSTDGRTRVGCVLVDQNNTILTTAYNGFLRDIDDKILPNYTNPDKYKYILHSEENAISNCARTGKSTNGCKAYLTGPPCHRCYQLLYQAGCDIIYHGNQTINMLTNQEYIDNMTLLKYLTDGKLPIIHIDFDLNKLSELI